MQYVIADKGPRMQVRVSAADDQHESGSLCISQKLATYTTVQLTPNLHFWDPRREVAHLVHLLLLVQFVQVPSYWVAQLQMEMLASGTHSIVLLSRSATKVPSRAMLAAALMPGRISLDARMPQRRTLCYIMTNDMLPSGIR
jgi:hypothetical protein